MARPENTNDYFEYYYDSDLGYLVCWFHHEEEEKETASPMVFELRHAWVDDIDIAPKLTNRVVQQIKRAGLMQFLEDLG